MWGRGIHVKGVCAKQGSGKRVKVCRCGGVWWHGQAKLCKSRVGGTIGQEGVGNATAGSKAGR